MHTIWQTLTICARLVLVSAKIAMAGAAWPAVLAAPCALAKADWKPVDADEVSLKAPRVEKDAPAEILFKEIRIELVRRWTHRSTLESRFSATSARESGARSGIISVNKVCYYLYRCPFLGLTARSRPGHSAMFIAGAC